MKSLLNIGLCPDEALEKLKRGVELFSKMDYSTTLQRNSKTIPKGLYLASARSCAE